jgi:hypothetical protein
MHAHLLLPTLLLGYCSALDCSSSRNSGHRRHLVYTASWSMSAFSELSFGVDLARRDTHTPVAMAMFRLTPPSGQELPSVMTDDLCRCSTSCNLRPIYRPLLPPRSSHPSPLICSARRALSTRTPRPRPHPWRSPSRRARSSPSTSPSSARASPASRARSRSRVRATASRSSSRRPRARRGPRAGCASRRT